MTTVEYKQLSKFVGNWNTEGKIPATDTRPEVKILGTDTYEWLPGNFFVLHKWSAKTGNSSFIGTEIIGYDETKNEFFAYFFDNSGFHPIYKVTVENDTWNFSEPNTKAKVIINNNDTITFHWLWKHDGSDWLPLCDRIAKRVK